MIVKILGTGCKKCLTLEEKVREVIKTNGLEAEVTKVQELNEIMKYGVMMTPGLVVNEKVKCVGAIPKEEEILKLLTED
ncbi:MAG: thioredoxin family protein [Rhodothermaceae bacterium]